MGDNFLPLGTFLTDFELTLDILQAVSPVEGLSKEIILFGKSTSTGSLTSMFDVNTEWLESTGSLTSMFFDEREWLGSTGSLPSMFFDERDCLGSTGSLTSMFDVDTEYFTSTGSVTFMFFDERD